jgi:hypothetical protein
MPNLRNAACSAPIGSAFDFFGFFWVHVNVFACIFVLLVNFSVLGFGFFGLVMMWDGQGGADLSYSGTSCVHVS